MASAILLVPASNFHGGSLKVVCVVLDLADHVAAGEKRRHRFEQRALAVEHADSGRPEHLVPLKA